MPVAVNVSLTFHGSKAQVFQSHYQCSVPVNNDGVTVSQHTQNKGSETAKWCSAVIHFIIYACEVSDKQRLET